MSKNNQIKKSDKKYIRLQKASIRASFSDLKKQEELITELYKRFLVVPGATVVKEEKKEEKTEAKKPVVKKETVKKVKKAKSK